jgi:predicted TIM-barrel fold metal-dependent hydrolase
MLIDAHCHIFSERIIANVVAKGDTAALLRLNGADAGRRLAPKDLAGSIEKQGFDYCVMLPSAAPSKVRDENDRFMGLRRQFPRLTTLATLHPDMGSLSDEIQRVFDLDVKGFKFSSFSQRFDINSPEFSDLLTKVEVTGRSRGFTPVAVFDTFARADVHFGANPNHLTTPERLGALAPRFPGINFIAAHMGGLAADFDDIRKYLVPSANLFLDTSNAAHTLRAAQFVELLRIHGASHILFGTDWPWFEHGAEKTNIERLLDAAGYDAAGKAAVFGVNAQRLLGL